MHDGEDSLRWFAEYGGTFTRNGRQGTAHGKWPIDLGWQTKPFSLNDAVAHYHRRQNVGLLTGEPSHWLIGLDVDAHLNLFFETFPDLARMPQIVRSTATDRAKLVMRLADGAFRSRKSGKHAKRPLEILCNGRQIAIAGIHDSGAPLVLENEDEMPAVITAGALKVLWETWTETPLVDRPAVPVSHIPRETATVVDEIKAKLPLVETAQVLFNSEARADRRGETRILGNGGLLVKAEDGIWCCHSVGDGHFGGDVIDLIGYHRYGEAWNRRDKAMFKIALDLAAQRAGVELRSTRRKAA